MSTPFSELMRQAASLKSSQDSLLRKKYDSWPSWYQNSLFLSEIIDLVNLEFSERFNKSVALKNEGNIFYKNLSYYEAISKYESSLSYLKWVSCSDKDWKKKSIDDSLLQEHTYNPTCESEILLVHDHTVKCLLNLALCYQKLGEWSASIRACDEALLIIPDSQKALFRRAQARYLPLSCGVIENRMALLDLKRAVEIDPTDAVIKQEYLKLKSELALQKKKDVESYNGFLNKPTTHVYLEDEEVEDVGLLGVKESKEVSLNPNNIDNSNTSQRGGGGMTLAEARNLLKDTEITIAELERDGKYEEADYLKQKTEHLSSMLNSFEEEELQKRKSKEMEEKDTLNLQQCVQDKIQSEDVALTIEKMADSWIESEKDDTDPKKIENVLPHFDDVPTAALPLLEVELNTRIAERVAEKKAEVIVDRLLLQVDNSMVIDLCRSINLLRKHLIVVAPFWSKLIPTIWLTNFPIVLLLYLCNCKELRSLLRKEMIRDIVSYKMKTFQQDLQIELQQQQQGGGVGKETVEGIGDDHDHYYHHEGEQQQRQPKQGSVTKNSDVTVDDFMIKYAKLTNNNNKNKNKKNKEEISVTATTTTSPVMSFLWLLLTAGVTVIFIRFLRGKLTSF